MSYRVEFTGSAAKELARLHPDLQGLMRSRIEELATEPRPRGVEALKGKLKGLWRIRVGEYRVLYSIDNKARVVAISAIAPRGGAYT